MVSVNEVFRVQQLVEKHFPNRPIADIEAFISALLIPVTVEFNTHDSLVETCLASSTILDALKESKKILAIKELRTLTGASLKPCKDAVEDHRVDSQVAIERLRDKLSQAPSPWDYDEDHDYVERDYDYSTTPYDREEPPF